MLHALLYGLQRTLQRPGLTLLLYAVNLLFAFLLTLNALSFASPAGVHGFARDLAERFDLVLWADLIEQNGSSLGSLFLQVFWILPLFALWKIASSAGLIHALKGDGRDSFWKGVATHTGRALLLSVGYLVPLALLLIGNVVLAVVLNAIWPGEVASFRIYAYILPTLLLLTIGLVQLVHDFGRIALIRDNLPVWEAWKAGIRFPFQQRGAIPLFVLWALVAVLWILLPFLVDPPGISEALTLWGLFFLHQFILLLRAGTTVAWTGSEVGYFEKHPITLQPPAPPAPPPDHAPDTGQSGHGPDR